MPRTTAQNEQIRAATKANIVNSAMALFARHGYAHTPIRKIADAAGISTGLTYHYFDSKDQLLRAVFDNCMAIISAAIVEASTQHAPAERLPHLLRRLFAMLESDPEFWSLFYMMRTQPAILEILGDDFRLWTARLREIFIADLRAAARPQPEMEALLLYSLVEGTIQQYLLDPDHYPLQAVVEQIISQFGSV